MSACATYIESEKADYCNCTCTASPGGCLASRVWTRLDLVRRSRPRSFSFSAPLQLTDACAPPEQTTSHLLHTHPAPSALNPALISLEPVVDFSQAHTSTSRRRWASEVSCRSSRRFSSLRTSATGLARRSPSTAMCASPLSCPRHAQGHQVTDPLSATQVWLHRGAYGCAEDLALGRPTVKCVLPSLARSSCDALLTRPCCAGRYVNYAMHRVRMLKHFGVTPVLVFDGGLLPSKMGTEDAREACVDDSQHLNMRPRLTLVSQEEGRRARSREGVPRRGQGRAGEGVLCEGGRCHARYGLPTHQGGSALHSTKYKVQY